MNDILLDIHTNKELAHKKILDFLKNHQLSVISTIHTDGHGPESAVVAYAETDNLELVFGTSNQTRKYKNIQNNNNISFVIGWDSNVGTIQYEGVATEIPKEDSPKYVALRTKKNPESLKFVNNTDQRYFLVQPTWIRFSDYAGNPSQTYEITF
jgi:uncharacterized pyridoxamine 5'-phosphate oxidase family protein